ncbi:IQ domain-containing protein C isoform X2 [Phyllopteryx taeniolatus]|uniref:IQ domain-containing protein C isoform X2 n=1 Tax=Phyllopteryx taeniolatus TaxID=161469 RepID=UPI002AD3F203|nr:IQ domain-containing protein C isoform X2 [Phyllopteryx taeniolatus]
MDTRDWDKTLSLLQAWARGRLVRAELRRAQVDFEEVVKEIDGTLAHLRWRDAIIPTPHFTDTDGPLPRKDPGPDVGACSQNPALGDAAPLSEGRGGSDRLHTIEAQKDGSGVKQQTRGCLQSSSVLEAGQNLSSDEVFGSTMDSTSIWTSMDSLPHKGPLRYCSAQEVPPDPEALRCHRDALTMELLWLQQAIDSRKKYLSLKNKLSLG